ncbi:beta-hydroxyacyl-ACP dehydratase [Staphylococcus saprophyticus]|jgi:3-hydroxyacyl-[acyl-carrier-protein] dehydratase|uniref:3-hydroxyacyl-[acyl-carrier-protein] dehydratase FabZ n=2 Tax=Staphylococcus saprophyticus TaxID=29385 RepID=FABZ_STAS1|nr:MULTISPECIES: 3-hydroxyacyl-ACP dehydratase FabZ [Staphylococcus]Q49Z46.1 RecName: Full=3-hydroxyacyl-[acyl-carrier-protein] dehydratase FabZ; AltName: Full=(3R)-hydroxymyristoyl-[acyl-carrier-protein] dehydratase; Short=(3R)-hydroxymyristoyl-ACP dehydrase; AltName: Full=Beta-hydroxyacyl-ACP dehydratase [Staphylococcus saprophyticus subsp. saprophyticus ATCC 15305 = NCTC 7292]CRV29389.1 (3R)-hydroxymyristoyl-ACP dehydratase [Streptococcus equi subsp. equi]AMG19855.1 beta-hydroxyacyl-ACP dehyd
METIFDYNQIKEIIPHRQPFLLIDRVVEYEVGTRCVAIKQVSGNEPFFQGHFPEYAVMPGVLITEALAQTGAVAILNSEENKGKLAFFAGIDKCRFKKQVTPGDTLKLEVEITKMRGPIGKGNAKATVDGEVACSCELTFAIQAK